MKRGIIDNPSQAVKRPLAVKITMLISLMMPLTTLACLKFAFLNFAFPSLTASLVQVLAGAICVRYYGAQGAFPVVKIVWPYALLFSVGFCVVVTFADLSLRYNALGTFLVLKVTTLFWIPLVHIFWFGYAYSCKTLLALTPVAVGAAIRLYFDWALNLQGALFGLISAVATAIYQVYVSEKQQEIQVNSIQLLYYEAPISAVLLVPLVFYFDPKALMISLDIYIFAPVLILLAAISWGITQMMTYWAIGHTTCTEYNVLSQLRFAVTAIMAYCWFDAEFVVWPVIAGDVITLCGIILYTHLKLVDSMKESIDRADKVVFPMRRI